MRPRALYYIVLFVVSLFVMSTLALSSGLNNKVEMRLDQMISGTAYKPFVYRQLMPTAIRFCSSITPAELKARLTDWASKSSTMSRILKRVNISPEYFVEYALTLLFIYGALWFFIFFFRLLLTSIYEWPEYFTDLATIATLTGIPTFFGYSFIYDIPTLALFTGGLLFMVRRRWVLFLLAFFLVCWSKETTILLTLVFAVHFYKSSLIEKSLFRNLLVLQATLFLIVKSILTVIYRDNPGGMVEFHLLDNLLFGYQFSFTTFIIWIFGAIFIVYKWNEKPSFLKDALWIGVPLIVLTLFLGLLHEMRDYGELYPILFALMAHSVALMTEVSVSLKENL